MSEERQYTSRRQAIVHSLVDVLKCIDGSGEFTTNLYKNVHSRLLFWDEVAQYPAVHIAAGAETREYQGGGYKDRFLTVTIRCYVQEENSQNALWLLVEDVETMIEQHSRLTYKDRHGKSGVTQQISIISITTDEGALEPIGVAEVQLEVRY